MPEGGGMIQSKFCAENASPYNYVDLFVTSGSFISQSLRWILSDSFGKSRINR